MLKKPFGGAFTASYYPHVDGVQINPPTQTPVIRIFATHPSEAQITSGTGAVATVATWVETVENVRTFTVAAIADPADGTRSKRYWIGLSYIATSGGSLTFDWEQFELVKPDGQLIDATPTAIEVRAYDGNLFSYFNDTEIVSYVGVAESKVKQVLKDKKIVWTNIENPDVLKPIIVYRAVADMWSKEVNEENDKFDLWRKEYQLYYENALASVILEYDANNNDDLDDDEVLLPSGTIRLTR